MRDIEWVYQALTNKIKTSQLDQNYAIAMAASVIAELLGKEEHCVYCTTQARRFDDDIYFTIDGDMLKIWDNKKLLGKFKIRRCPVCGRRIDRAEKL